jgi:choline dehydrogenase-like flavoprotein
MAGNGHLDFIIIGTGAGGGTLAAMGSLMGHAVYGLVLGGIYKCKP